MTQFLPPGTAQWALPEMPGGFKRLAVMTAVAPEMLESIVCPGDLVREIISDLREIMAERGGDVKKGIFRIRAFPDIGMICFQMIATEKPN